MRRSAAARFGFLDPAKKLVLVTGHRRESFGQGFEEIRREVDRLCRRARALGRFVSLWCQDCDYGAATQLAASERLSCPLPAIPMDPCDLMQEILYWESGTGRF